MWLQISWTEKKSNQTVLLEAGTTRSTMNRMHKRHPTYLVMNC